MDDDCVSSTGSRGDGRRMLDDFLIEREPITWSTPEGFPASLVPAGLFTQEAPSGLEVLLATATRRPTAVDLRRAWSKRRGGRASPVLLVAAYPTSEGQRVSLCGPAGDQPMVQHDVEVSQAERLAEVALGEPSHHAATRFLLANLPELDSPMPGLRNVGLLATQELRAGVPDRPDWRTSGERARPLLELRGCQLVKSLGYGIEVLSTNTSMLTINGRNRAIAVFCDEDELFDAPAQRFNGASPVSQALAVADQTAVDWVILTRSSEIRLYAARSDTGVGRKAGPRPSSSSTSRCCPLSWPGICTCCSQRTRSSRTALWRQSWTGRPILLRNWGAVA